MSRRTLAAGVALAAFFLVAARTARADMFSPGELARPHADLEGLRSCTKCHVAGQQLSDERCLECHTELAPRLKEGKGFHGRLAPEKRSCELCHHEHQGRDVALVAWEGGSQKKFDHAKAGWALKGAHAKTDCAKCHDARLVDDPVVQSMLKKHAQRKTFLGLGTSCRDCHFDEHRGQLGNDCASCHDEKKFAPAPGFDHAKTEYALVGKHRRVSCDKCHPKQEDAQPAGTFPAPKAATFAKFDGVPFARCTDCHEDPHENRFGANCQSCHTPEDWKQIRVESGARSFHNKTKFPLRGAHADVSCRACHGQPMKTTGLAFGRCADCHVDAHAGQLGKEMDCDRCHTVDGFAPARFDVAAHARTTWPLEGEHRSVTCRLCHPQDPALTAKVPKAVRAQLKKAARKELFSAALLDVPAAKAGCNGCHADAHGGQLGTRACDECHTVDGFAPARFDVEEHARTKYPLAGAHRAVSCRLCHPNDPAIAAKSAKKARTLFASAGREPLVSPASFRHGENASSCRTCHADVHAGQFAARVEREGCESCHVVEGFERLRFDHAKDSRFALTGKHADVTCAGCHASEKIGKVEAVRYRPLETACAACHRDPHAGQFVEAAGAPSDCARCHTTEGFAKTAFQHAPPFTDYVLQGRHADVACASCHPRVEVAPGEQARRYRGVPRDCESCHVDQHQGAFSGFEP